MIVCAAFSPPLFFFLSSVEVFGEDLCSPSLLNVKQGVHEKFIPKKGEACCQCSFQKARWQAFEEASEALLFGYVSHAVQQASVAPHLHRTDRRTKPPRETQRMCSNMVKHAAEELTIPKRALAASKPPTCSLFLNRSKGYVIVLLIIPAPLPQTRLLMLPWKET